MLIGRACLKLWVQGQEICTNTIAVAAVKPERNLTDIEIL